MTLGCWDGPEIRPRTGTRGWGQGQTPAHPPRSSHGRHHTAQTDLNLALEAPAAGWGHFSGPLPLQPGGGTEVLTSTSLPSTPTFLLGLSPPGTEWRGLRDLPSPGRISPRALTGIAHPRGQPWPPCPTSAQRGGRPLGAGGRAVPGCACLPSPTGLCSNPGPSSRGCHLRGTKCQGEGYGGEGVCVLGTHTSKTCI